MQLLEDLYYTYSITIKYNFETFCINNYISVYLYKCYTTCIIFCGHTLSQPVDSTTETEKRKK